MSNPFRVVVLDDYLGIAHAAADWSRTDHDLDVRFVTEHIDDPVQLRTALVGANAIVAMRERTALDAELLGALPKLRLVITAGMRNEVIGYLDHLTYCGTRMLPTPTAELAWGLVLAVTRNIVAEDGAIRRGHWQTALGEGLAGQTLGIVGLGRLGQQVARIGGAFGMRVVAWSENLTTQRAQRVGAERVSADELFETSDVVSLHLRLSDRTAELVDAHRLRQMKPSAILINTSRAAIVDMDALARALAAREIAGAGLDVFDIEPLPADDPIRTAPNTVLTPHLGYGVRQNLELIYSDALEQINAYLAGEPLRSLGAEALAAANAR